MIYLKQMIGKKECFKKYNVLPGKDTENIDDVMLIATQTTPAIE
jgi:hypothetical protein